MLRERFSCIRSSAFFIVFMILLKCLKTFIKRAYELRTVIKRWAIKNVHGVNNKMFQTSRSRNKKEELYFLRTFFTRYTKHLQDSAFYDLYKISHLLNLKSLQDTHGRSFLIVLLNTVNHYLEGTSFDLRPLPLFRRQK